MNNIVEFGHNKYVKVSALYGDITPLMSDLAEMTLFVMAKNFPKQVAESRLEIDSLKQSINDKEFIPPIWVEVDRFGKFVTVVDGFHRILAFTELGIVQCNIEFFKRIK